MGRKIVSFYSGDLADTLASRKVSYDTVSGMPEISITLTFVDPAYFEDEDQHTAKGDEIVMYADKAQLSKDGPEITFTYEDNTTIFLNLKWQLDGRKVNHGQSFTSLIAEENGKYK